MNYSLNKLSTNVVNTHLPNILSTPKKIQTLAEFLIKADIFARNRKYLFNSLPLMIMNNWDNPENDQKELEVDNEFN
jgi:hypothetical protein